MFDLFGAIYFVIGLVLGYAVFLDAAKKENENAMLWFCTVLVCFPTIAIYYWLHVREKNASS
jgi:hypothetical protein